MANAKQMAREVLDQLPDDSTFADIEYHIRVRELVEDGRCDLREGRTYATEEVERDLARWLGR